MTDERLDALLSRIGVLDPVATQDSLDRQAQLTKPAGSLGVLEQASVQLSGRPGADALVLAAGERLANALSAT